MRVIWEIKINKSSVRRSNLIGTEKLVNLWKPPKAEIVDNKAKQIELARASVQIPHEEECQILHDILMGWVGLTSWQACCKTEIRIEIKTGTLTSQDRFVFGTYPIHFGFSFDSFYHCL